MVGKTFNTSSVQLIRVGMPHGLVIGLVFVILIILALISLPALTNTRAEALRTHLNDNVLVMADALTATEDELQQMQAATRGYALTQAPVFLEQYRTAQDGLPVKLQQLAELGPRVDPALEPQVAELAQMLERWQRERGDLQIALIQQGRASDAVNEVASANGQVVFDSFRARVDDIQTQLQAEKAALLAQINRARTLQVALTSGLGTLGLLAVGFVISGFRRLVALTRDLQDEREHTAALAAETRTERQRLQAVFDHSPEGLLLVEAPNHRIVLANQAAHTLLGPLLPDADMRSLGLLGRIYRPGGDHYPTDELPLLRSLERGEECRNVELTIEQADGQRVPVVVTKYPVVGRGWSLARRRNGRARSAPVA